MGTRNGLVCINCDSPDFCSGCTQFESWSMAVNLPKIFWFSCSWSLSISFDTTWLDKLKISQLIRFQRDTRIHSYCKSIYVVVTGFLHSRYWDACLKIHTVNFWKCNTEGARVWCYSESWWMGCRDADCLLFDVVYGSILGFCEQVDEPSVSENSVIS